MSMHERKTIDLEQGWEFMQKGVTKLKNILEGLPEPQFSSEDYMMLYTYVVSRHLSSLILIVLQCVCVDHGFVALDVGSGLSTTCALRNPRTITPNSYMTSTESRFRSTLLPWKKLARRLLFDKSANDDHERSILTKLKQQCGGQFTSKMEGMVTDLTLARENQSSFEDYLNSNPHTNPGIDLTVTVLTTGFWPSYKSFDLNLPAEMVC
ncbi:hypothetical protein GW17_00019314 [Ensete ventricosum]|nr:hypothetical protein GW17_00019314 [Ensete ventricosum]